jgi:hypothetical protein
MRTNPQHATKVSPENHHLTPAPFMESERTASDDLLLDAPRPLSAVTGEGWDEPGLPPWHGVWSLIAPSGLALPWDGTLTTMTIGGKTVLATL